jgi:hypothetical protein
MGSHATGFSGGASLTVLLTEAVGSDGAALQAWASQALKKKAEGDGTLYQQLVEAQIHIYTVKVACV